MAIILNKYAIKEVADVMFYELDSKGAPSAPVLYLDTLKTSTLEQSSETVDATGGKGNVKLLSWDTNKELTLTLEDALFSAKSLGIMFGGTMKNNGDTQEVLKTLRYEDVKSLNGYTGDNEKYWKFTIKDNTYCINKKKCTYFVYTETGVDPEPVEIDSVVPAEGDPATFTFVTFDLLDCTKVKVVNGTEYGQPRTNDDASTSGTNEYNGIVSGITIDVTSNFDSNTYYITGDTYARNFESGQDEFLQFIIPKGKVSAEDVSLTMEADGDPATFSMSVKCLKANDGTMIKLVKYNLGTESGAIANKGVASILDHYNGSEQHAAYAATTNGDPWNASKVSNSGSSFSFNEGTSVNNEG